MAKVIIAGASGLVGQATAARLAGSHEVICLGRRQPTPRFGEHCVVDLANADFPSALPQRADAVIYLAQSNEYANFPAAADDVFAVNLAAVARLLEWARAVGVAVFVHASSGGIYGAAAKPFAESDPPQIAGPLSYYFHTKHCAEGFAQIYRPYFNVVTLRPFFVYGPGQHKQRWLPQLVGRVRDGRPVRLAGEQGMRLNPVHVSDVAAAIERCLELGDSDVVNIAGPDILAMREIAEMIGQAVAKRPVYEHLPAMPAGDIVADITHMSASLGAPAIHFDGALPALCRDEQW